MKGQNSEELDRNAFSVFSAVHLNTIGIFLTLPRMHTSGYCWAGNSHGQWDCPWKALSFRCLALTARRMCACVLAANGMPAISAGWHVGQFGNQLINLVQYARSCVLCVGSLLLHKKCHLLCFRLQGLCWFVLYLFRDGTGMWGSWCKWVDTMYACRYVPYEAASIFLIAFVV